MAYYVTTDGVDQTIELPAYTFPTSGIVRLYIDQQAASTNSGYQISVAGSTVRFTIGNFGNLDLNFAGSTQSVFGISTGARLELALEWDFGLNVFRILVNGTQAGSDFAAASTMSAFSGATTTTFYWGRRFGSYIQSDVYVIQISESGTIVRDYDPSLSGGTGLAIPESLGGTSAPLINYDPPNDDSQWVFYSSGGATYTLTLDPGSYTYTGSDTDLIANRNVLLDSGLYAYTGNDADFIANRNVLFNAGSYLYTGNSADLLANRNVSFDAGSYSYTGSNVNLSFGRNVSFDAGNYIYSGSDVNLLADRNVSFDPGSYLYTGQDLTLTYTPDGGATYTINLDAGAYQITGSDIILAANRAILLDSSNYSYTGESVILATNRKLSLDAGSYAVTGNDVSLLSSRKMLLDAGNYTYAGSPVTLVYSGQIISLIDDYSVNYADDTVKSTYSNDFALAEYSNEFITARF